jgi:hypothetical protein
MEIIFRVTLPNITSLDPSTTTSFRHFLQAMMDRRIQGACRYGDKPKKQQLYRTRIKKELIEYDKTHNMEQLLNVAVYCWLESEAPQNGIIHFDANVESVTRSEMGGNVA